MTTAGCVCTHYSCDRHAFLALMALNANQQKNNNNNSKWPKKWSLNQRIRWTKWTVQKKKESEPIYESSLRIYLYSIIIITINNIRAYVVQNMSFKLINRMKPQQQATSTKCSWKVQRTKLISLELVQRTKVSSWCVSFFLLIFSLDVFVWVQLFFVSVRVYAILLLFPFVLGACVPRTACHAMASSYVIFSFSTPLHSWRFLFRSKSW